MQRCTSIVFTACVALAVAGCAEPVRTEPFEWTALGQPPDSVAQRTFAKDIDVVRALAYGTVIDLGLDITSSDGLGEEQGFTASSRVRDVQVLLERLGAQATRVRVAARSGAGPEPAMAERVVDGIAARL